MFEREASLTELAASADKAMRAQASRVMEQRVSALEKKGLPAGAVYGKLKSLSAKYSGM